VMRTLIIGASLVGCHVAQKLAEMGEKAILFDVAPRMDYIGSVVPLDKVTVITGDIVDMADLIRVIKKENIEQVVHTAFMLTATSNKRPHTGVRVNIGGTSNVLEAALLMGVRRVVFTSSVSVYHRTSIGEVKEPYNEDVAFKAASERPATIYALTKLACEHLGLAYHDLYGLDFVAFRIAGIFGPYKPKGSEGPNAAAVRDVVDAALSGKAMTLECTPGWQVPRELVYVKDVASAIVKACSVGQLKSRVYNIGAGRLYDYSEVVEIARRVFPGAAIETKESERTKSIPTVISWLAGIPQLDISLAQRELGYIPQYDMEKAITDFGEWVMKYDMPQYV